MNWAKGRATRGRGTSFRGALRYVLHDKEASTANRVGFIELRNLATDDPHRAWHEMMTLCEAADALKQRAGVKATGRKLTKPVYAFSLNWHVDDRPTPEHMRETAESALQALGMDHLQAVIVEHTDTAHRHLHLIVNLVDPETGKAASLSNDGHKLDRWADTYELSQGVIRSPERRAKFEALDQGRKPPKRSEQATSREEWLATRKARTQQAKDAASSIKAGYAEYTAQLRSTQSDAYSRRRTEADRLWTAYKADRQAIRDRYQPFIDAIFKSRRKGPPHPYTEQALHNLEDSSEWKQLGREQFAKRRAFSMREQHMLGRIANAIRLHSANRARGGVTSLFMLAISRKQRRKLFERVQDAEKQALRGRQMDRRKARADRLRAACRFEQAKRAERFRAERAALLERHAAEIAAEKALWRQLGEDRRKVWAAYREEFGIEDRAIGQSLKGRNSFQRAANGNLQEPAGPARGAGTLSPDRPQQNWRARRKPPAAPAIELEQEPGRKDWRARRSAAERKADGSYRPRDRSPEGAGKSRGRSRRPPKSP